MGCTVSLYARKGMYVPDDGCQIRGLMNRGVLMLTRMTPVVAVDDKGTLVERAMFPEKVAEEASKC